MAQDRRVLQGNRIRLRPPAEGDAAMRFALGNHRDIHAGFGGDPKQFRELTEDVAEGWYQAQLADPLAWIIEYEDRLIGVIRLHSLNHADKRANLAIGILDPKALGLGLGPDAVRTLARHAFETLGLHRLTCRVLSNNARAIKAYESVGFVVEGREREAALIGSAWHDDFILGLLPSDLKEAGQG